MKLALTVRRMAAILIMVIVGSLAACGTTKQASLSDHIYTPREPVETLSEYRSVYALLAQHPLAAEMTDELGRVGQWLDKAERIEGSKEPDSALVRLYTEAIGGELVVIKTWYDLRASEARAGRTTTTTTL